MAVYTELDSQVLDAWLAGHGVGDLISCDGIASGIENSNFFVDTRDGATTRRFVLTIFERIDATELSFCLALMSHLAEHDVPCPAPIADRHGQLCSSLKGKPAALVTRLDGHSVKTPAASHCTAIGETLARLHRASTDFALAQPNPRGAPWWRETSARVGAFLDTTQKALLDAETHEVAEH